MSTFIFFVSGVNRLRLISVPDISVGGITALTFHHRIISAWGLFGSEDVQAHGHSVSMDILA